LLHACTCVSVSFCHLFPCFIRVHRFIILFLSLLVSHQYLRLPSLFFHSAHCPCPMFLSRFVSLPPSLLACVLFDVHPPSPIQYPCHLYICARPPSPIAVTLIQSPLSISILIPSQHSLAYLHQSSTIDKSSSLFSLSFSLFCHSFCLVLSTCLFSPLELSICLIRFAQSLVINHPVLVSENLLNNT
jgi:hypothetical protein